MHKQLITIDHKYQDSDEGSEISVSIFEDENGIRLNIEVEHLKKQAGAFKTQSHEEIQITEIDGDQLHSVQSLIDEFLESASKATISESLSKIEGNFAKQESASGRHHRPERREFDFNELLVNVGETCLSLKAVNENGDYEGLEIPSASRIEGVSKDLDNLITLNNLFYEFLANRYTKDVDGLAGDQPDNTDIDGIRKVERIFDRFDVVANQLRDRSRGREPLVMDDEYDVQYLMHALLRLYFDDVRDETYLSRVANKSPRIDFLLEQHEIGIEIKRASTTRPVSDLLSELAEDKEVYRKDPICDTLLVFIFDPERTETNPAEIEKDLSEATQNLTTRVTLTQ